MLISTAWLIPERAENKPIYEVAISLLHSSDGK